MPQVLVLLKQIWVSVSSAQSCISNPETWHMDRGGLQAFQSDLSVKGHPEVNLQNNLQPRNVIERVLDGSVLVGSKLMQGTSRISQSSYQ